MTTAALPALWCARAEDLERFAPSAAQAFRECAQQLTEAQNSIDEKVTLKQASLIGGYSVDALQKMVAAGRVQNVGRKHKPLIKRLEVPIKPRHHRRSLLTKSGRPHNEVSAVVASVTGRSK